MAWSRAVATAATTSRPAAVGRGQRGVGRCTAESSAFEAHAVWLRRLLAEGVLIAAGLCLGQWEPEQALGGRVRRRAHVGVDIGYDERESRPRAVYRLVPATASVVASMSTRQVRGLPVTWPAMADATAARTARGGRRPGPARPPAPASPPAPRPPPHPPHHPTT